MNYKALLLCAGLAVSAPALAATEINPLTLDTAVQQALAYSPALKARHESIGISRGGRLQSALPPNPEFSAELENILGTDTAKGMDKAEITLGISQPIELGGKRNARINAADAQISVSQLEYTAAALDVIRDTQIAWTESIAAYEEVKLAKDQASLASDVLKSVSKRVAAAAAPAVQKSKSEIALASSHAALRKAENKHSIALRNLASLWGQENPQGEIPSETFFNPAKPDLNTPALDNTPDVHLAEAGISLANTQLAEQKANAAPDITVGAGIRDSRDSDDQSFVASLSIPFPVFNRNQGAILKAGHEAARAEHQKSATLQGIQNSLAQAHNAAQAAWQDAESLQNDILPAAERAFAQARQGYQAGKFPHLDVLDAQRTLAEIRLQHIAALKEYHLAQAQIDRLTAKHLPLLKTTGDKNDP